MYALGVMLWEAITLRAPWPEYNIPVQIAAAVRRGRRPHLTPELATSAPPGWVELMTRCWAENPADRPAMDDILEKLQDIEVQYEPSQHTNHEGGITHRRQKAFGGGRFETLRNVFGIGSDVGRSDDDDDASGVTADRGDKALEADLLDNEIGTREQRRFSLPLFGDDGNGVVAGDEEAPRGDL